MCSVGWQVSVGSGWVGSGSAAPGEVVADVVVADVVGAAAEVVGLAPDVGVPGGVEPGAADVVAADRAAALGGPAGVVIGPLVAVGSPSIDAVGRAGDGLSAARTLGPGAAGPSVFAAGAGTGAAGAGNSVGAFGTSGSGTDGTLYGRSGVVSSPGVSRPAAGRVAPR
jgi:hypothetical protein